MTWSYSLWLEAAAIIPQINVINKEKGADAFIYHYIACLGSYRFIYIIWWAYRYLHEGSICYTSVIAGIVQVVLYADFYWLYYKK